MSYDLMVFDKSSAPKTRVEFKIWYEQQTEWAEEHTYDDPAVCSKELKDWFLDMIKIFPALNGPYATEEDSDRVTDYSVGIHVIYAAFSFSMAGPAYKAMVDLAEKHQVGFFDVSGSEEGDIFIPVNGKLQSLDSGGKNWWKFW